MATSQVKTESKPEKTLDLVSEIQRTIVKINDLLVHKGEAEYVVDLMNDNVIKRYGRERAVEAARTVLKESVSQELSNKCTDLWRKFDERYFSGWLLSGHKVQVRYILDGGPIYNVWSDDSVVHLPASSEPVLVQRMLEEMIQHTVGRDCRECYRKESNRVHYKGAPMSVEPNMRHLSAEEFIAAATREPTTEEEEHRKLLLQNPPAEKAAGA
jgi:hypothetical protein